MSSLSLSPLLSPLVSHALNRAAAQESALHAWACLAPPTLLTADGAADASAIGAVAPAATAGLSGWPIGVKDIIDVAGMPTQCGSAACGGAPARFDAACVAMLRAAGCVPIGKTVTTEFAYVTPGPTRNPTHLAHTPGGSSSGSAAAVAAGQVRLALGTQTGGSMIRPAAFCGVVGFKPTHGVVPRGGMVVACESLDVIGWYARSVQDVVAAASVLLPSAVGDAARDADPHPGDADGAAAAVSRNPVHTGLPTPCRIAFLPGHPGHRLDDDADAALVAAWAALRRSGVHPSAISEGCFPAQPLLAAHHTLMHYEFARSLLPVVQRDPTRLSPRLLDAVTRGLALPGAAWTAAKRFQARARDSWATWFGDADLILTSSVLGAAPKGLAHTGDSAFNKGWSVLGWPCIHLPTAYSDDGLPLGVMLVGRPYTDHALLACAAAIHPLIDTRPAPALPRLDPILENLA
jgi:Asp-tRNA(Asn)/Glu-tRNA(Gln) amidotransferase A subunit family amidase